MQIEPLLMFETLRMGAPYHARQEELKRSRAENRKQHEIQAQRRGEQLPAPPPPMRVRLRTTAGTMLINAGKRLKAHPA